MILALFKNAYLYNLDDSFQDYYSVKPLEISSLDQIEHEYILKLETMSIDAHCLQDCLSDLHKIEGISTTSSMAFHIEITSGGVHKAKMLEKICKEKHLAKEEILVLGDSENDREIFEAFPNSVAVANVHREIKHLAKYETKSCNENGVAYVLNNLIKMQ